MHPRRCPCVSAVACRHPQSVPPASRCWTQTGYLWKRVLTMCHEITLQTTLLCHRNFTGLNIIITNPHHGLKKHEKTSGKERTSVFSSSIKSSRTHKLKSVLENFEQNSSKPAVAKKANKIAVCRCVYVSQFQKRKTTEWFAMKDQRYRSETAGSRSRSGRQLFSIREKSEKTFTPGPS